MKVSFKQISLQAVIQSRTLILSDLEAESQQLSQDDLQDYDMPSPDGQSDEDEESRDGESGGDDNNPDTVSDCNSRGIGSTQGTCNGVDRSDQLKELHYPSSNKKILEDTVLTLCCCECLYSVQGVASQCKTAYEPFHLPRNVGETALSY